MPEPQTELDIARAMARGDLPSPQKIGNCYLFSLRVTGTGKAYRSKLDEFVLRDPRIFLSRDFLERAGAGVPIVLNHPENNILDDQEYRSRSIGSTMLGFQKDNEAWAIGRIYDSEAAAAMESLELSTSPAVVLKKGTSERRELSNGKHLLIEGVPYLLDHLAVVSHGVWDGGKAGSGVERSDQMSDEKDGGTELDKVLKALAHTMDDCLKKIDGIADSHEKLADRIDDLERDRDDRRERDDRRRDDRSDRRTRRDGEPRAPGEPHPMVAGDCDESSPDYREKITGAQMKADASYVANGFGGAPKPMAGESVNEFRLRLMRGLQKLSARYKDADLKLIGDPRALSEIETQIFADSERAALDPTVIGPHLHPVTRRDAAGHSVTTFYGDPAAWLSYFGGRLQRVTAIRTTPNPAALTRQIA